MKYAILLAAGAALSLSACQESGEPAAEATATDAAAAPATEAAAPAAAATVAAGLPPTKEFMVGTWGEGDECELPMNFQADGTIKDGPFDKWTLTDGNLVMDDLVTVDLKVVDQDTLESRSEGATETRTLKRCG